MRVTIKQIAEIAGVHRSTVDKVLHNRGGVSKEVTDRIKRIIDELQYKPNVIGKALAYQKKPLTLAVVLLNTDSLPEIKKGIEDSYLEYASFGLKINYYYVHSFDGKEQINILNTIRHEKISGLIITPVNTKEVEKAINEIVQKGIPTVTINTDIPDSKRMCFIGQDTITAGKVAGELMGQILGGNGKVVLITSSGNFYSSSERKHGFELMINEKYSSVDIVEVIETYEQKTITFEKTLAALKQNKELDGIYITCGNVDEVGKAIKQYKNKNSIKVICFDLYPEIVELVKDETITFTIGQDLYGQGYKGVKTIFEYLFYDRSPETDHIKTTIDIRVKENIDY